MDVIWKRPPVCSWTLNDCGTVCTYSQRETTVHLCLVIKRSSFPRKAIITDENKARRLRNPRKRKFRGEWSFSWIFRRRTLRQRRYQHISVEF
ncbi:hypothetical protein F0562_003962 [Nyssa sinensis]|uniref:Uncharacterized protein n=1 Tax=Nyssa sinensis TaxID=561372 RepID=A0A5J5BWL4_9ASTE|nr:hypothetical protein F0562_003962 [Nyssa sinensis]